MYIKNTYGKFHTNIGTSMSTIKPILNYREQTEVCWKEGGERGWWVKWVTGIKWGTCDEHWVLYVTHEFLKSAPKASITLHIN